MGRLIPAGTGFEWYRHVRIPADEPPPPPAPPQPTEDDLDLDREIEYAFDVGGADGGQRADRRRRVTPRTAFTFVNHEGHEGSKGTKNISCPFSFRRAPLYGAPFISLVVRSVRLQPDRPRVTAVPAGSLPPSRFALRRGRPGSAHRTSTVKTIAPTCPLVAQRAKARSISGDRVGMLRRSAAVRHGRAAARARSIRQACAYADRGRCAVILRIVRRTEVL